MIRVKAFFDSAKVLAEAKKEASYRMQEVSSRVENEISEKTPKDTGEAAADWRVVESGPNGEFDLINGKDYVKYLNRGSSRQAPAMFIEATVLKYGNPSGVVVTYKDDKST